MAPNNSLPIHGNEKTMNLNHLILTNIQSSPYFKVNLFELKTYHEVIDEIYYKVNHLEPWEKGSRKTAGQTGMCGGVRGVGAGGIVSSAYCLLYKLFTLRLTRKQVIGLLTHQDSPYIRGLGFMYIRYTQPPPDLWDWYQDYLDDEEEIDVKAGGGHTMLIGEMVRQFLSKLEWYSTLFPRIPVPVQKSIEANLKANPPQTVPRVEQREEYQVETQEGDDQVYFGEAERIAKLRNRSSSRERQSDRRKSPPHRPSPSFDIARERERQRGSSDRGRRSRSRDRDRRRSRSTERTRDRNRHRSRSRDRDRRRSRSKERKERRRDRSHEKRRSRSRDRHRESGSRDHHKRSRNGDPRESSFERDLRRERERQRKHESKSSHGDRNSER